MSALPAAVALAEPMASPVGFELGDARSMIGRHLVLRENLLGFAAGTRCRVQCVVDFGDGLLLWITTADQRQADVDQIDADDLEKFFEVLETSTAPVATQKADATAPAVTEPWHEPAGFSPVGWLQRAGRRLGVMVEGLADALELARFAERQLSMSDTQLAARGLRREQVIDYVRERVYRQR